jgi:Mor family transcriptional regulator
MRHAVATGLSPKPPLKRGTDQHKARLNEEKVRQIRAEHANGAGIARLARQYGVGESTIRNVVRGNTWAWLTQAP